MAHHPSLTRPLPNLAGLNFIPNVGMASSVCLPMPLVLLDPSFGPAAAAVAFVGPLVAGLVAK
eukprot:1782293-Prymnesium_polylepis.1